MKRIYITDFGAIPGSEELQTAAIQAAVDSLYPNGGEVRVPAGTLRTAGIRLRSNTTLYLEAGALLEGSRDPELYHILAGDTLEPVDPKELRPEPLNARPEGFIRYFGGRWHNGLIRAYDAKNIAIIGEPGSIIDGMNCYDAGGEEAYRGPHAISIIRCEHIVLRGFTVRNSANWPESIWHSRDILCEDVVNLAGHDGIHITSCDDIIIRRCTFRTGDDCIAGFDNYNVLVEDCELNTACSAFRFGGTNMLIHHCHIHAPAEYTFRGALSLDEKISGVNNPNDGEHKRYNMLSIFTYYADFTTKIRRAPQNIVIRDCLIENADRFLYFNYSGNSRWQINRPLAGITFQNLTVKGLSMPLTAYGDPASPVKVNLTRVNISLREGAEDLVFIEAANFREIRLTDVSFENSRSDKIARCWSEPGKGRFVFDNVTGIGLEVEYTDQPFVSRPK